MFIRNVIGFYLGWSLFVTITLGVFIVDVVRKARFLMLAVSIVVFVVVVVLANRNIHTIKPLIGFITAGVIGVVSLTGIACLKP